MSLTCCLLLETADVAGVVTCSGADGDDLLLLAAAAVAAAAATAALVGVLLRGVCLVRGEFCTFAPAGGVLLDGGDCKEAFEEAAAAVVDVGVFCTAVLVVQAGALTTIAAADAVAVETVATDPAGGVTLAAGFTVAAA